MRARRLPLCRAMREYPARPVAGTACMVENLLTLPPRHMQTEEDSSVWQAGRGKRSGNRDL